MTVANPSHQVNDTGWCECALDSSSEKEGCGRIFAGLAGFDAHHVRMDKGGDWWLRCLTNEEMTAKGLYADRRGWWHLAGREAEE